MAILASTGRLLCTSPHWYVSAQSKLPSALYTFFCEEMPLGMSLLADYKFIGAVTAEEKSDFNHTAIARFNLTCSVQD
ncbi:hypothetical protein ANO11243_094210 [Dothideomycetidae sp. 11243]|nr:hypothetical protein ANO11243_094210 [fungal sp. No.11243]